MDARHQWRFRTRAWAKLSAGANTDFVLGLANESRKLTTPHVALTMDETVIENLYLDHRFADGASIRIGRQNFSKGDGFILTDGSPLDGSRVAYFNAFDLGWTSGKSRLDLLIISDPYRDQYLPRIHDRTKSLIEWDENALGLYWTGASCAKTTLDAYYFFKAETGDTRALTARQGDRMFHTLGGRLTRDFPARLVGEGGVGRAGRRAAARLRHPRLGRADLGEEVVRARDQALHPARLDRPLGRRSRHDCERGLGPALLALPEVERVVHLHAGQRTRRRVLDESLDVAGRGAADAGEAARSAGHVLPPGGLPPLPGQALRSTRHGNATRGDLYEARADGSS